MVENPLVSIVIPVYNGSNYLREAIESALNQTYSSIEVLVINDGSDDGGKVREIALSFGDRIRYFEKENGGVATALNMGIKEMRGIYFSWLSHDDRYKPEKIEDQMRIMDSLENKLTIIYGGYELIDENGKVFYEVNPGKTWDIEKLNRPLFPIFKGLINGCSVFFNKAHFERVGLFNEDLLYTQDMNLWFRMFRGQKIYYQPEINVQTRIHEARGSANPERLYELNNGWIRRMHNVTRYEMRETMGSIKAFYSEVVATLNNLPDYREAYDEALRLEALYDIDIHQNYKVSVVIPFYNRIALTIKSIQSALNQTYNNIEVIVVDNGSTEDLTALKDFISTEARVKYFYEPKKGSAVARNKGIEEASGEYIAFLDSDDTFEPTKIEKQLRYMIENEFVFSHTYYTRMDSNEKCLGDEVDLNEHMNMLQGKLFPRIIYMCLIATPTVMIKRGALQGKRFQEEMDVSQDICMWIDMAYDYEVGFISERLTKVRICKTTTFYNKYKERIGYFNILRHIFANRNYLEERVTIRCFLKRFSLMFFEPKERARLGKEELNMYLKE